MGKTKQELKAQLKEASNTIDALVSELDEAWDDEEIAEAENNDLVEANRVLVDDYNELLADFEKSEADLAEALEIATKLGLKAIKYATEADSLEVAIDHLKTALKIERYSAKFWEERFNIKSLASK